MRVLLVHGYYRERGGEDVAFETDARLLADAGHDVRTLPFHNTEISDTLSLRQRIGLAASTVWSRTSAARVETAVLQYEPDVVHFHNTFPLISPAAFSAVRKHDVPVVATLHNYRMVCANANLYRDGAVCELCIQKPIPYPAVAYSCYRGGRAESAVVASMQVFHSARRTWNRDVDRFIAPSAFAREKLVQAGLPAERVSVRSNAVMPAPAAAPAERAGILFAGRLAENKGVATMLEAWKADGMPPLRIAGDGEMAPAVREAASSNPAIEYLGALPHDEVLEAMRRSVALLVPSTWYEIQGLVILEAFSTGTPVIASNIGAISEAVRDGQTGLLFPPGDAKALGDKWRWAAANAGAMRSMGDAAQRLYESEFSPERSLAQLLDVYDMARAKRGSQSMLEPHLRAV